MDYTDGDKVAAATLAAAAFALREPSEYTKAHLEDLYIHFLSVVRPAPDPNVRVSVNIPRAGD